MKSLRIHIRALFVELTRNAKQWPPNQVSPEDIDEALRLKKIYESNPESHTFYWETDLTERKRGSYAVEWAYNRYIKNDSERLAHLELLSKQSALAQQIYDIRNKLHMTREDLAEFSGLTPEVIEDLEESDYEGNWDEAINRINRAFRAWISDVIIPMAGMTPEEYSVKAVNA